MKSFFNALVAFFLVSYLLVSTGCGPKKVHVEDTSARVETIEAIDEPASGAGEDEIIDEGMAAEDEPLVSLVTEDRATVQDTILEGRTSAPFLPIYFDFDKSNIRDDQRSRIEENALYLKNNPAVIIRIEGNCDERGTDVYNMALGERRALSAKKYLVNLGISAKRIRTLSFGEEQPLLHGHDELSWAQNRRDDFVIIR
jgi:peptidoglycan-associated lipoprotein